MALGVRVQLNGLEKPLAALVAMRGSRQRAILRRALTKATRPIVPAARAKVPVRFGLLKKSLGRKLKTTKDGVVYVVIGPRKGMKKQVGTVTRGPRKGQPVYEDPAKIAHLVEQGHGGPHPAPAHPFLGPTFDQMKGQVERTLSDEILKGLIREALRG